MPSTYKGKPVTKVANFGYFEIEEIVIPEGVKEIANYTFQYNYMLKKIEIPTTVTTIGAYAFLECHKLVQVKALCSCDVPVPNNPEIEIVRNASINFQSTLSESGDYVCLRTQDKYYLMGFKVGVSKANLSGLPSELTDIYQYAFENVKNLTDITIPSPIKRVGKFAFERCKNLTSVTLPNTLMDIGVAAFYDCRGLTNITIPNSVKSINNIAFSNTNLTSVIIPNSVITMEGYIFKNCNDLNIYCEASEKPSGWDASWASKDQISNPAHETPHTVYWYSENVPQEDGNYWHYVNNVPTIWD